MHTIRSQGFTLIELLVVIAIIGVLSAVVLASLNTARSKGNDAAIESNLATIQTQAELYYNDTSSSGGNNTYGTAASSATTGTSLAVGTGNMFVGNTTVNKAVNSALSASGVAGVYAIGVNGQSYAIAIPLKTNSATSWCIDSTGGSKVEPSATPAIGGGTAVAACPQ